MEYIEDSDIVASEHDILISAVSKLDKSQHITEPTRNESTISNSEFNLIKRTNKLDLRNVVRVLENTATHVQISKKLKKTQNVSKILHKPVEKPLAERIKRVTGYEETSKRLGRWDPVVARSRTADFVSFPIKSAVNKLLPTHEFLSKFELKSSLEKELETVDPPAAEEEEDEEERTYPMSYEEMVEHRQHLAKLRAQQSYQAAKAKRQSKIKSKKFHRVLKKEKLKQQLKEFEELQKTNPEEALKELETLEKARALERHTLRHKNTGKWAKNKLIRAKYDKGIRQQLAEQLAVSRSLTQKMQDVESSDDDCDDIDVVPDIGLSQDPMNPWMMKQSNKSNVNAEFDFGYKKYLKNRKIIHQSNSDSDSNDDKIFEGSVNKKSGPASEGLENLKEKIKNMSQAEEQNDDDHEVMNNDDVAINKLTLKTPSSNESQLQNRKSSKTSDNNCSSALQTLNKSSENHFNDNIKNIINKSTKKFTASNKQKKVTTPKVLKPVATANWFVEQIVNSENYISEPIQDISVAFESLENNVSREVEIKLKKLRKNIEMLETRSNLSNKNKKHNNQTQVDNLEYLKLNQRKKAIIDEELIETGSKIIEEAPNKDVSFPEITNAARTITQESTDSNIDPNRFIEVKPKYLNTALPDGENELDLLDDDEQVVPKVNIEDVFEEDDVVASFRQEKENEINKDKLEDIDLSLPGWGSWGGKGVKAPKRKRNRFILKAPPKMPRRDENKGDIIIQEFKDPKLARHKVKDIPFPFTSVKDYEASIRAPLGNTFIPEKPHKNLIRPSVITKAGTIIEPMDEEELLMKRNQKFVNEKVIRLLAKK